MKQVYYLFGQLSDSDVDWLGQNGRKQISTPGATLIHENSAVDAVYIILRGQYSVSTGAKGEVSVLSWGEIAGEMSFVDGAPATATLTATEESEVLKISHQQLHQRIRKDISFAGRFYRATTLALTDRLREQIHNSDADESDELSPELLDTVHTAGARFDRLMKHLQGTH